MKIPLRLILTGALLAMCITVAAGATSSADVASCQRGDDVCLVDQQREVGFLGQAWALLFGEAGCDRQGRDARGERGKGGASRRVQSSFLPEGVNDTASTSVYLGQMDLTQRTNVLNRQRISHEFNTGDAESLAETVLRRSTNLSADNVVQAAEKLAAKLPTINGAAAFDHDEYPASGMAIHLLTKRLINKPHMFKPAQFTQALRAIAVDAKSWDSDLVRAATWHLHAQHAKYSFPDCVALSQALVASLEPQPELMDAIADRLLRLFDSPHEPPLNTQLAVVAASFAKLRHKRSDLFEALSKEIQPHGRFPSDYMTNMLWAYASMDEPVATLFDTAARRLSWSWEPMLSVDMVTTLWAFTSQQINDTRVYDSAIKHLVHHGICYSPHELTRLAWAFATQRIAAPDVFDTVAELAAAQSAEFSSGDLADLLWSYAIMNIQAPQLFEAAEIQAMVSLEDYEPHSLSNLVWSFATSNIKAEELFRRVASRVEQQLSQIPGREMHVIVHSFQMAGMSYLLKGPGVQMI